MVLQGNLRMRLLYDAFELVALHDFIDTLGREVYLWQSAADLSYVQTFLTICLLSGGQGLRASIEGTELYI